MRTSVVVSGCPSAVTGGLDGGDCSAEAAVADNAADEALRMPQLSVG